MTSHTACLEPTENSRSSLVIAGQVGYQNMSPTVVMWRYKELTVPVFVDHHNGEKEGEGREKHW